MQKVEREVMREARRIARRAGLTVEQGLRGRGHHRLHLCRGDEVLATVHFSCTPSRDVNCETNLVGQAVRRELRRIGRDLAA